MHREIMNALCKHARGTAVEIPWDMEKCFDLIQPWQVAYFGIALEYPAVPMCIAMVVHTVARGIAMDDLCSSCWTPDCSILQGCMQSLSWTRCIFYNMLQKAHEDYGPATTLQSFVDDMAQRSQGPRKMAMRDAVNCALHVNKSIQTRRGRISPKSNLFSTDKKATLLIHKELVAHGLLLTTHSTCRDLGVDANIGNRRRMPTFAERTAKSTRRRARIQTINKLTKGKAAKLALTGFKPQATWGRQALGMAPTTIGGRLRRDFAQLTASYHKGGSNTVTLAVEFGPKGDPAYFIPKELLCTWLDLAPTLLNQQALLARLWDRRSQLIQGKDRWKRVKDHIGAVIATLRDLEWAPDQPYQWTDPEGATWMLDWNDHACKRQLMENINQHSTAKLWVKAQQEHADLQGIGDGPDLTVIWKQLRYQRKKGNHQLVGLCKAWASGACPTQDTRYQRGHAASPLCPRCGEEFETELHRYWTRSDNNNLEYQAVQVSQNLVQPATEGAGTYP